MLDTNVLVAAVRSGRGASRSLLESALAAEYRPLVSVPLMIEYEAVLKRPEHLEASGLTSRDVDVILDALATAVEPVRLAYLWRPLLRDVGDDMVLETAVNGRARAIVTLNRRDFEPATQRFELVVLSPAEALGVMRRSS